MKGSYQFSDICKDKLLDKMTSSNSTNGEEISLSAAIVRVLRPLVRFLVSRGFTYIRFIQILRPIYVEVAETYFSDDKVVATDSRISLLTGIARRYVKEIRTSGAEKPTKLPKISPAAKLVAQWVSNPRYQDKKGMPLLLSRLANQTSGPSFEELANIASNDVRPRTLLENLLERSLVEVTDNDQIQLLSVAYQPNHNTEELIDFFGAHIHDHIAATTNNIIVKDDPYFDRSAFQDELSERSIAELNQMVEHEGMLLLRKVYARAAELSTQDKQDGSDTKNSTKKRFRLGIYAFSEDDLEK